MTLGKAIVRVPSAFRGIKPRAQSPRDIPRALRLMFYMIEGWMGNNGPSFSCDSRAEERWPATGWRRAGGGGSSVTRPAIAGNRSPLPRRFGPKISSSNSASGPAHDQKNPKTTQYLTMATLSSTGAIFFFFHACPRRFFNPPVARRPTSITLRPGADKL